MFDKLKQIKQLKDLQNSIKQEKVEIEKEGVKIIMNGSFMVEEIKINPDLDKLKQEKILMECFNEAAKKIQSSVAQKFSGLI